MLCRTSNPSSGDLQDEELARGGPLYAWVAGLVGQWNAAAGHECLGLVAGATHVVELAAVRAAAPSAWLLCPGVGAQGGTVQEACHTYIHMHPHISLPL